MNVETMYMWRECMYQKDITIESTSMLCCATMSDCMAFSRNIVELFQT